MFIPTPQDADLQIDSNVTLTATGNGTTFDFTPDYAPGGLGRPIAVILQIAALVGTGTYVATVYDSPDGSTWSQISVPVTVNALGIFVLKAFSAQEFIRVEWTVGGTSPSVNYNAWVNPNIGQ